MTDEAGVSASRSSIKSPSLLSSSLPMGVSNEIGSCATLTISRNLATVISIDSAISSSVGLRPLSCASFRVIFLSLLMVSTMCTGIRIVRA